MNTVDADRLERISDKTFDRVMIAFHTIMNVTERLLSVDGLEKEKAEHLAKYMVSTAMIQIATLVHKKIGIEKDDFFEIVKESWEENDDPPSHRLKLVKSGG